VTSAVVELLLQDIPFITVRLISILCKNIHNLFAVNVIIIILLLIMIMITLLLLIIIIIIIIIGTLSLLNMGVMWQAR